MEVDGITVAKAAEIENGLVVTGVVNPAGYLVLTTKGGTTINAGLVKQPAFLAWPIGSIFMNIQPVDPSILLGGGTWVRWAKGRMPISLDENDTMFDSPEELGGAKTHTLTVAEMPSHGHAASSGTDSPDHAHASTISDGAGNHSHVYQYSVDAASFNTGTSGNPNVVRRGGNYASTSSGGGGSHNHTVNNPGANARHAHTVDVAASGGGAAHNNMPPFISVYMWKRTA
jgi:microcystin-dependent protein